MSTTTLIVGLVVVIVMVWMAYIIIDQAQEIRALEHEAAEKDDELETLLLGLLAVASSHPDVTITHMPLRESEIEE